MGKTAIKIRLLNVVLTLLVVTLVSIFLVAFAIFKVTMVEIKADRLDVPLSRIKDVPQKYWSELSEKKIFFAHRELGAEIIDGIKSLVKECNYIELNIVETTDPCAFDMPVFAHAKIGICTHPDTKTNGLLDVLDRGVGEKADIIFLKFCYGDLRWESDAQGVFDIYCKMVEEIKNRYPRVELLHITVPIGSKNIGNRSIFREAIKLLVGRPSHLDDNLRRQQYNTLLCNSYPRTGYIFDVALIESINQDGLSCYTKVMGIEKVLVKAPEYSISGGHLNAEGRKIVAEQLLITLARMAGKK